MSQKPAPKPDTEESSSTESEQSDTTVPDFDVVSSDDPKMDAKKFVTGDVKYTADYEYEFQDIASGKIVRSEIAHGYVKAMDTSSAEEMDGVYAVLTPWSEEIPDEKY
ncbi:MAG: hypoxanthine oxidase, partial [Halodesulfurarchaeum sp.]|nr:hypoxanthine oxidase [Halodesulfurarchaeum sp.]